MIDDTGAVLLRQGRHRAQAALNLPRAHADESVQLTVGLRQLLLRARKYTAELFKLGFDCTQYLPDLGRTLLDGEGAKAHLQAVQKGCHRRRPCDGDFIVPLEQFEKASACHLCVKPFEGQKHNGEIGRIRRVYVLVMNLLGEQANTPVKRGAGKLNRGGVPYLVGVGQLAVRVRRELRVNRQPYAFVACAGARRYANQAARLGA